MSTKREREGNLPIRRDLHVAYACSLGIAVLMAAASVVGLHVATTRSRAS
jgi:hypothetical protein